MPSLSILYNVCPSENNVCPANIALLKMRCIYYIGSHNLTASVWNWIVKVLFRQYVTYIGVQTKLTGDLIYAKNN